MRRLKGIMLTALLVAAMATTTYAGTSDINVTVDGQAVTFTDAVPFVDSNGRTMMPVAKIGELLKVAVGWNPTTQTVTLKGNGKEVSVKLNDENITVNGMTTKMDTKAVSVNGRTYVPMSAIAKAFGVTTSWDKTTNTVSLKSPVAIPEKTKDTVTNGDLTLTAELVGSGNTLNFNIASNSEVRFYIVIGKNGYFENKNLTTEELRSEINTTTGGQSGRFENDNYLVEVYDKYYSSTKLWTAPPANSKVGDWYNAKIFGVTESGETTGLVALDFKSKLDTTNTSSVKNDVTTLTATLIKNNNGLDFNVNTNVDVNFYFLVGKSEYVNGKNFTVDELKAIGDNAIKNQRGRFATESFFGVVSTGSYDASTTGFLLPENAEIGTEYTAKIFGVTATGETTGVASLDFILK